MKKKLIILMTALVSGLCGYSQLTGTKFIPGDFNTITEAIVALNNNGVGPGGVTFSIAAGYTETFSSSYDGLITVNNKLASRPIVFNKKNSGQNPRIYSAPGNGYYDFIIGIAGVNYLTFDGIDLYDSPTNGDNFSRAEYGFLFGKSDLDSSGTQYCTIKNCTVSLNRTNTNSSSIILRNWLASNPGYALPSIKDPHKANSYNSFQGNTFTNSFNGIYMYGSASLAPYMFYDQGNDIGSVAGNTISNFGNTSGQTYGIYCQYENGLIIANNLITSTVTGGSCYGITLQSTSAASLDLYGNTITINYSGTFSFYGIQDWMGNTGTTSNVVNIHDNTVTGCVIPNALSTVSFIDIGHGGPYTNIYNNVVTGNVYGTTTSNSNGQVNYLWLGWYPEALGTANIYNNSVTNNIRYQSPTASGGSTYYMRIGPQCNVLNVYGNICDNNTSQTNGIVTGIECMSLRPSIKNIYNNQFTNLHNANGTTYCISVGSGYSWNVHHNKIQDVESLGANAKIYGLILNYQDGAGDVYVYDNIIGNLKAGIGGSNSITGLAAFCGPTATHVGIYYNTIFLNASSTAANFGTTGLFISKAIRNADLRNNLVVNNSVANGSGIVTALSTDSTGFGNLSLTSNNNLYYAGVPSSSQLIFSDGVTNYQTLTQYRSKFFPREYNTVTENPTFMSISTPVNLHLDPTVATQCESGGTQVLYPVTVTDDYDQQPRYPNAGYPENPSWPAVSTDIGADEIAGIPVDHTGPYISYSPFANVATMGDRTLIATITDAHGVPSGGTGLPRVCWKKNTGGTWSYVTGSSIGNNKYSFQFGGGSALGDTIYYFVVAQDSWSAPNVGCTPLSGSGGYTVNPPAALIPPSTPDKYVIVSPICGTFNVGAGGTYPTLTAAINDINSKGLTCPVTLVLTDNTYNAETYPITLQQNGGSSSVNTLTIKPKVGMHPVFSSAVSGNGLFKINGFDYLIIDGSASGGTDKNLTFFNYSETNGAFTIGFFNKGGIKPSTNITVKNIISRSIVSMTAVNYGFYFSNSGAGYENISITGDSIQGANTGIYYVGNFSAKNSNGSFTHNVIGSAQESRYITDKGILMQFADNTLISGNDIMGPAVGNNLPTQAGIYILSGSENTRIDGNLIHDFYRSSDDGSGAYGIWYEAENTSITKIFNNSIYGIKSSGAAPGTSPNNCYGIYIASGGQLKIIHNSIWLYGSVLSPTGMHDASSACIGIYKAQELSNNIEIRNNVMKNSQQGLFGTCPLDGKCYGIMTNATDGSGFSVIDNNDYYIDGCNGQIGFMYFNNLASLSQWQAATGQEQHSLYVNPLFISATMLKPTASGMGKAGSYITDNPRDITGILRTNPPDIGAYEFTSSPVATTNAATNITVSAATLNGSISPAGQNSNIYFEYGLTTAYGTVASANPSVVSGSGVTPVSLNISNLTANTTYHFRVKGNTFSNIEFYGEDMTFNTLCTAPAAAGMITGTSVVGQGQSGVIYSVAAVNGATGYVWSLPPGASIVGGTNSNIITVDFSASASSGTVTVYAVNNCGNGTVSPAFQVTVIPAVISVSGTTGTGQVKCYHALNTITVAGDGQVFIVQTGGSATFIAGQRIFFYAGTVVQPGGYLHAWIAPSGPYCENPTNPIVNTLKEEFTETGFEIPSAETTKIRVFPNPATGSFTIDLSGNPLSVMQRVDIFTLNGTMAQSMTMNGERSVNVSAAGLAPGIYFLHVLTSTGMETLKLVKM